MARSARAALITEPDPYKVLGLTPKASSAEIEKARRRVAAAHHPDTGPASERAERELAMKRINVAYELLRDPGARAAYDLAHAPLPAASRTATPHHAPPATRTTGAPPSAPVTPATRARRRPPRRRQRTAASGLTLLRAIGSVLAPLAVSRTGLYALLGAGLLATATYLPERLLPAALLLLLLPPLLLRRLAGTPAGDLIDLLRGLFTNA